MSTELVSKMVHLFKCFLTYGPALLNATGPALPYPALVTCASLYKVNLDVTMDSSHWCCLESHCSFR